MVTTAVAVDMLVRLPSFPTDISPSPSSSELSECSGLVKLRAVLAGVVEEEVVVEEEEEERWEEDEDGATRSQDGDEVLLGKCFSGLLQAAWAHAAWPAFASALSPQGASPFSLVMGR